MPGNELIICKFLLENVEGIELKHIGEIKTIGAPSSNVLGYTQITRFEEIDDLISSEDSRKKADIYLNGTGVSLKQTGGSFSFNRLQRAELSELYFTLRFSDINKKLLQIDTEVERFHAGLLDRRDRPWQDFFNENDFKNLTEYLMMKGSPNVGASTHPANLILEAPAECISKDNILVYTFDEYFEKNKLEFKISIRRSWVGQSSNSEHNRAVGLARKPGNVPWVFDGVGTGTAGGPRKGWREDFPLEKRKTVYYLMISKPV